MVARSVAPPSDRMIEAATRLSKWSGVGRLGADEVLTWWLDGRPAFALRGDALRMELRTFRGQSIPNRQYSTDVELQRALGLEAHADVRGGQAYGVQSELGQTLPSGQLEYSELLDGVEAVLGHVLGVEDVHVTLMPKEGAPWVVGSEVTPYYSSRKRKVLAGAAPDAVTTVESTSSGLQPAVDMCRYTQRVVQCEGPVVGELGGLEVMATHSLTVDYRSAADVAACGGLLYASLAIGEIPATPYGPLSLACRLSAVLEGMKPYKSGRGAWPVVVYDSDAWTGNVSAFRVGGAMLLFQQLTGNWVVDPYRHSPDGVDTDHFWTLGPPISASGINETSVGTVSSTTKLSRLLRARAKLWKRGISLERMDELSARDSDRYPYLEAKSAAVLPMSCFPVAVCPSYAVEASRAWLRSAGWNGDLVDAAVEPGWRKRIEAGDLHAVYQWSWAARDALISWARSHRAVAPVLT